MTSRHRFSRTSLIALCLVAVGLALAGAIGVSVAVAAATRHGVTPRAPAAGATVPTGRVMTFFARARGGGEVYVRICRSKATRRDGLICATAGVARATRGAGGLYRYTPKVYGYPDYWLNRAGTYYWQAYRIRCENRRTKDCRQEGPVVEIKVG